MKRKAGMCLAVSVGVLQIITSCGGGSEVTLKVGAIPTSINSRRAVDLSRSLPTDADQSNTPYAYAKVDGIKLQLTRLQAVQTNNERDIITWSPAKEVVLAPGTQNTISISETAEIEPGTYSGVKVRYQNAYSVKAFCRTDTKFVYTTATQIKTVDVGSVTTLPTDYDYFSYPFAETTTATSKTGGNPETMAETRGTLTVTEADSLSMAVLFDPSYLVTCFDGTTTNVGNTNSLSPFMWGNNHGLTTADFFPNNTPNFGMGYVPIFVWVSTDPSEAIPTAETYAASTTRANVQGSKLNFNNVAITSFAFRADGSVLDARARISANGGGGELYQMFSGFTKTGSAYGFKNGEWNCDAGFANCGPIQDRSISGFTRTTDFTSDTSSTYDNGADCGKTILFPEHPEWGNRARACLGSATNMYWRQLTR